MGTLIRSVLRHRVGVRRGTTVSGETSWETVAQNVPCLIDTPATQTEPAYTAEQQKTADRSGVAFFLPSADVRPGDRLISVRGTTGTFLVKPDPATQSTLNGISHREFRIEEVPS